MNSLGIVGGIVFVIGIIVILVSLYYRFYRLDSGLNILNFIGIMIVASKKSETKQTTS
jgi:hypothetical protein